MNVNIIKKIIVEEINEIVDNNNIMGNYPDGYIHNILDENKSANDIYQNSLNDSYWKEISDKFPNYNSNKNDTNKAVNFIFNEMKNKHPNENWDVLKDEMKNKIMDGIT